MTDTSSIPLIGISMYRQDAAWRGWDPILADVLPAEYARAVEGAGGAVVLIPPVRSAVEAAVIARTLDGLILAGGADVNPERYGQTPHPEVTVWRDDRDSSELALIAQADERELPILGVCRGMQLLAVSRGGSLMQHLPDELHSDAHLGFDNGYDQMPVTVEASHRISDLIEPHLTVACHHHQIVDQHPGFTATAYSDDGVLHAMEQEGDRFVVGVQWHPETMDVQTLFNGFVAAARARMAVPAA